MTTDEGREGRLLESATATKVRNELVQLRVRAGISENRVARKAKVIQRLAAVEDELRRNSQLSRSGAAYSVIRCAVFNGIQRLTFQRILIRTLNFDDAGGDDLTERRSSLMTELYLTGLNNYDRKEREAYAELAFVLTSELRSPCHKVEVLDFRAIRESLATDLGGEVVSVNLPLQPIIEKVLEYLTNAVAIAHVAELLLYLRECFPASHKLLQNESYEVKELLIRVLFTERAAFEGQGLTIDQLRRLFDGPPFFAISHGIFDSLDVELALMNDQDIFRRRGRNRTIDPSYYSYKSRAVRTMARLLTSAELTDSWSRYWDTQPDWEPLPIPVPV